MFVKLENNIPVEWPVGDWQIRAAYPQTSFPYDLTSEIVSSYGYAPFIFNGPPSSYNPEWQNIEEVTPLLVDGKYQQSYKITEKFTPEEKQRLMDEQAKQQNKAKAEGLLTESDWSDKPSVTDTSKPLHLVNAAEWEAYRDALRLIAVRAPVEVSVWPVKPEEIWSD